MRYFYFWLIFSISLPLFSEEVSFKFLYDEYKKGNYDTVSRLSGKFLTKPDPNLDPRFFFLYVSTEKDWDKLKSALAVSPPSSWKGSSHYWNGIYLFMERALVLGENDLLVKWGKIFQKEGKGNTRYADSLFLLAFGMAELKNFKEAAKILDELEAGELSPKLATQVSGLRAEMKGESP